MSMDDNEIDIEQQIEAAPRRPALNMSFEAVVHRAIARLLNKRDQGRVMGAIRESLGVQCYSMHGAGFSTPGSAAATRMAGMQWDEAREHLAFEDAAHAHYLRKRCERAAKGQAITADNDRESSREEMFAKHANGDYVVWAYQAAWGGWKMARGGA